MAFTTNIFLFLFLPICVLGYYAVNLIKSIKLNNLYLVAVSLAFYAWCFLNHAVYLLGGVVFVYLSGKMLERLRERQNDCKKWLAISVILLFGLLTYYKYFGFIVTNINSVLGTTISIPALLIPLGLSFIIFEATSYLVDVFRGEASAGSLLDVAMFVTFFPKVVSGPIVLWRDFENQISNRTHTLDKFHSGLERIMIGFGKKVIIADTLGGTVSSVLADLSYGIDSGTAFLGALCYTIQLYYDFSGYSDIAIGLGRLFGFDIKENFDFPYTATSIGEFWRRWHISLGRWFREYIYIPLGGNRRGNVYFNLMVVFLVTGIWHGASWNFILWGVLHGVLSCMERKVRNCQWYKKTPVMVKWAFTFTFVFFTWIIFMVPDLGTAYLYLKSVFVGTEEVLNFTYLYYLDKKVASLLVVGIVGAFAGRNQKLSNTIKKWISDNVTGAILKEIALVIIFVLAIIFMVNSTYSPFLYFQF